MLRWLFGERPDIDSDLAWINERTKWAIRASAEVKSLEELKSLLVGIACDNDIRCERKGSQEFDVSWSESRSERLWFNANIEDSDIVGRTVSLQCGGDYDGLDLSATPSRDIAVSCSVPINRPLGRYAKLARHKLSRRIGYFDLDAMTEELRGN